MSMTIEWHEAEALIVSLAEPGETIPEGGADEDAVIPGQYAIYLDNSGNCTGTVIQGSRDDLLGFADRIIGVLYPLAAKEVQ